jgi:hypothetical protein
VVAALAVAGAGGHWVDLYVLYYGALVLCILLLLATLRWPSYFAARVLFRKDRNLPWHVMAFLADAHARGIRRRVGSVRISGRAYSGEPVSR